MSYMRKSEQRESRGRNHRLTRRLRATTKMAGAALATAVLLAAGPVLAAAQTCLGDANLPGQFSLGGYAAFADDGKAYGAESRSNLPGMVGMGARIGVIDLDDTDENITSVGGHLAFEVGHRGALSFCPVGGVEHDFWSGAVAGVDLDYSRWAFPVGLAVGTRVGGATGGPVLIPSAQAGLIHQRFSGSASSGPFVFQRQGNTSDFFLDAGATVHLGPIYARGGVYRIFQDEADTILRLGMGFVF